MRYTFADVVRPGANCKDSFAERLSGWWFEWPLRRNVFTRWWWGLLLFYPGQGWLRWGMELECTIPYGPGEEWYSVAPPLRRLWESAACIVHGGSLSDAREVRRVLTPAQRKGDVWG